jgi:hypothetical protein
VWEPSATDVEFHVKVTIPVGAVDPPLPSIHSFDHQADVICALTVTVPLTVAPPEGELMTTDADAANGIIRTDAMTSAYFILLFQWLICEKTNPDIIPAARD